MGEFFISPEDLWASLGRADAPRVYDVRRRGAFDEDKHVIPGAIWCSHLNSTSLEAEWASGGSMVLYCVHGHQVSQSAAARARAKGLEARVLEGGIEAWKEAKLPTIRRSTASVLASDSGAVPWVIQRSPCICDLACCWLVLRFFNPDAEFFFVDREQVVPVAKEINAAAIGNGHPSTGGEVDVFTFEALLELSSLQVPSLDLMARTLKAESLNWDNRDSRTVGLSTIIRGLSTLVGPNERELITRTLAVFDALYADLWHRYAGVPS